jgi:hypothetical protein
MPKKKLWIFGDSYAAPNHGQPICKRYWEYLKDNFDIDNFAISGTGPGHSFKLLADKISKNSTVDTSLLFLVSSIYRFDFPFLKNENHQCRLKSLIDNQVSAEIRKDIEYLEPEKKHIEWFFKNYALTVDYHLTFYHYISSLSVLSNKFEKTLVWNIFPIFDLDPLAKNFSKHYRDSIAGTSKFQYVNYPLYTLSSLHDTAVLDPNPAVHDPRPNHFGEEMHDKLGTEIVNYFTNYNYMIDIHGLIKEKNIYYPTSDSHILDMI